MKLVSFDDFKIGVLADDGIHDISEVVPTPWRRSRHAMTELIRTFDECRSRIEDIVSGRAISPEEATLLAPVPSPTHILAAPLNYRAHVHEMVASDFVPDGFTPQTAADLGFFLKATGSLVGASGAIELPRIPGRVFHHECELAVVVGRECRDLARSEAQDSIFGYSCLMDITMRNTRERQWERVMRKSFETFTPMGPAIVTADEVGDPSDLALELWVDGELRQAASTRELVVDIPDLLQFASTVLTLQPGDVYATGTPEGVGPIHAGETVAMEIDRVGRLEMPVRDRMS